jgi:endonuclease/exonuclease/phosphatase family metal-dependent hydrolase
MTYNVHGCRGIDGRHDLARIGRIIQANDVDVVALQELDVARPRSGRIDQARALANQLGMHADFCSARDCEDGFYGNAILSRYPATPVRGACLPRMGHRLEPRAMQWARIEAPAFSLNVLNTHLGLDEHERLLQAEAILSEWLQGALANGSTVLCGDFNAGEASPVYRRLTGEMRDAQRSFPRSGTFPSYFPVLRIDHVLVSPDLRVRACAVVRTWRARLASDHLPIVAEIEATPTPGHEGGAEYAGSATRA